MCNTNVGKKIAVYSWAEYNFLLQDVPMADTSNVTLNVTFNIEVGIYIVSAKSELNLKQLKHFHMLLRMQKISFPRTKLSIIPPSPSVFLTPFLRVLDLYRVVGPISFIGSMLKKS